MQTIKPMEGHINHNNFDPASAFQSEASEIERKLKDFIENYLTHHHNNSDINTDTMLTRLYGNRFRILTTVEQQVHSIKIKLENLLDGIDASKEDTHNIILKIKNLVLNFFVKHNFNCTNFIQISVMLTGNSVNIDISGKLDPYEYSTNDAAFNNREMTPPYLVLVSEITHITEKSIGTIIKNYSKYILNKLKLAHIDFVIPKFEDDDTKISFKNLDVNHLLTAPVNDLTVLKIINSGIENWLFKGLICFIRENFPNYVRKINLYSHNEFDHSNNLNDQLISLSIKYIRHINPTRHTLTMNEYLKNYKNKFDFSHYELIQDNNIIRKGDTILDILGTENTPRIRLRETSEYREAMREISPVRDQTVLPAENTPNENNGLTTDQINQFKPKLQEFIKRKLEQEGINAPVSLRTWVYVEQFSAKYILQDNNTATDAQIYACNAALKKWLYTAAYFFIQKSNNSIYANKYTVVVTPVLEDEEVVGFMINTFIETSPITNDRLGSILTRYALYERPIMHGDEEIIITIPNLRSIINGFLDNDNTRAHVSNNNAEKTFKVVNPNGALLKILINNPEGITSHVNTRGGRPVGPDETRGYIYVTIGKDYLELGHGQRISEDNSIIFILQAYSAKDLMFFLKKNGWRQID